MTRKRSNGEGTISFYKDRNSYRAAVSTPDGRRIFKRFKTNKRRLSGKQSK